MITKQLSDWAGQKGYATVTSDDGKHELIARQIGDYTFSYTNEDDPTKTSMVGYLGGALGYAIAGRFTKCYVIKLVVDSATWSKEILKSLKKELKKLASPAYSNGFLSITVKKAAHNDTTYNLLDESAEIAARILSEAGVRPPAACQYCHNPGCDGVAATGKGIPLLYPAHTACAEEKLRATLEKLERKKARENYVAGFLASLLGAVVGAIPALLLLFANVYGSFLNFICYLFIPIGAYSFYRRANGAVKWGIIFWILTISAAAITFLGVWGDFLWLNYEYDMGMRFAEYLIMLLYDVEYLAGVIVEMLISYVFCIAGVIGGWVSSKNQAKRSNALLENLKNKLSSPAAASAPLDDRFDFSRDYSQQ